MKHTAPHTARRSTRRLVVMARDRRRNGNIRPTHGTTGCRDCSMYRIAGTKIGI